MDFIVVGGVCAVLHGAPISTFDLDLVHCREPGNIERLLAALKRLDAHYRTQPERKARPGRSHLSSAGHQLLTTRHGPLDLLGAVGRGEGYEELLEHTTEVHVARDLKARVLSLQKLIEIKNQTAAEKDRAVLHILRRTLEEQSRK